MIFYISFCINDVRDFRVLLPVVAPTGSGEIKLRLRF